MSSKPTLKYGDLLEDAVKMIRPLDLVLFRGNDAVSGLIKFTSKRFLGMRSCDHVFSHIGLVVSRDIVDDPALEPGKLYVWESTLSGKLGQGVYSAHHPKKAFFGTQVRPLIELIEAYDKPDDTAIAIFPLDSSTRRKIYKINDIFETEKLNDAFTPIFTRYNDRRYDANPCSLLGAMFPFFRCCRSTAEKGMDTEDWLFCSELVAHVFQDLGVLHKSVNPKNVVPVDLIGYDREHKRD